MANDNWYMEDAEMVNLAPWDGEATSVEPGEYIFTVTDMEQGDSRKGNPVLRVTYTVDSYADGSKTDQAGRTIKNSYVITGNGKARLKHFLTVTGVQISNRGGFNPKEALGRKIIAKVFKKTWSDLDEATGDTVERLTSSLIQERPLENLAAQGVAREATGRDGARGRASSRIQNAAR